MPDPGTSRLARGRHAGVIAPLFSIPSRTSWGIGEIADLPVLARWMESAGLDMLQLLPLNEMPRGQSSPYSAISAMAIDPIYLSVETIPEFQAGGGLDALGGSARTAVEALRGSPRVDYAAVRAVKDQALAAAFARFESAADPRRTADFEAFVEREAWWLADYVLFRALDDEQGGKYWREWPEGLRDRDPSTLGRAREQLSGRCRYYAYVQWIAGTQWIETRRACGSLGIVGDFPFMVNGHSADVWARQGEFHLDASVGVPVAQGSDEEQDWGLPPYRWDVIRASGYQWLRERTRRCAELFDAFRVDHLVGFYRTYARDRQKHGFFSPPDEPSQIAQGEAVMALFRSLGSLIIAEDLGVVPDFVRASQGRLEVPGLRVLRWERQWAAPGQPFLDPAGYPPRSVAISGTHDTDTMAGWWDGASLEERRAAAELPILRDAGVRAEDPYGSLTRDALLATLFHSASDLMLLVLQDAFGWRDRINTPSLVSDANWSWRLPYPVESFASDSDAIERAAFLRARSTASGRAPSTPH